MPKIEIQVSSSILEWIEKQLHIENVPGILIDQVEEWKKGDVIPTINQIEQFSKITHIPFGYFFLSEPPKEDIELLEFRTVESKMLSHPSRDLIDTINDLENIQDWMSEYIKNSGGGKVEYVGSISKNLSISEAADIIRKDLGIQHNWFEKVGNVKESFKLIRTSLEKCGILVMLNGIVGQNTHRKLNIEEFRALAILNEYAPVIFINSNDSENAKLFSLIHEATHIWYGENDFYNDRKGTENHVSNTESICNAVSAEIIAPQELFDEVWKKWSLGTDDDATFDKLYKISRYFKCGVIVIARKALDRNYIDNKLYSEIVNDTIRAYNEYQNRKKSDGGNYYATVANRYDNRFLRTLSLSVMEGKTLHNEAYRLTKTSRKTFETLIDTIGGVSI